MSGKRKEDNYLSMIEDLKKDELRQAVCLMAASSTKAEKALLDYLAQVGVKNPEYDKARERRRKAAESKIRMIWADAVIVLEAMEEGDYEELTERGFTDYYFEDANIDNQSEEIRSLIEKEPLSESFRLEMMEQILTDSADYEYTGEEELDLAWMLCESRESKCRYLDILREVYPYKHERTRKILQEIGSEGEYLKYLEESADIPENAVELYQNYLSRGEAGKAVEVLWKSLERNPNSQLLLDTLFSRAEEDGDPIVFERLAAILAGHMRSDCLQIAEKIAEKLEGESGQEKLDELLPAAFFQTFSDQDMRKWISCCQKKMRPEAYAKQEKALLSYFEKRNPREYCLFSIWEGRPEEALRILSEDESIRKENSYNRYLDEDHVISSRLLDLYPEEIERHYWEEVNYYRYTKEYYARCAKILCELQEIARKNGTMDTWKARFDTLVSESRRRRYLLAEFRAQKLLK